MFEGFVLSLFKNRHPKYDGRLLDPTKEVCSHMIVHFYLMAKTSFSVQLQWHGRQLSRSSMVQRLKYYFPLIMRTIDYATKLDCQ